MSFSWHEFTEACQTEAAEMELRRIDRSLENIERDLKMLARELIILAIGMAVIILLLVGRHL